MYPFRSAFCTEASYIGQKKNVCYMCILYFTNVLLMPEALLTGFVLYIYYFTLIFTLVYAHWSLYCDTISRLKNQT